MNNIRTRSLLNAIGVGAYVAVIALIMQNGERIFGKMNNILGPIAFLLMFVLSAAVTGGLMLGKPVMLYLDGLKKEAVKMFIFTVAWLFVITLAALLIQIII
ncbi:MAG: hypothetical protein NTW66_01880 [Candidatus Magasanikbacteria bacterium]|nr:hypothetical protein [Candidatus Magasanikbacteria bacterium]